MFSSIFGAGDVGTLREPHTLQMRKILRPTLTLHRLSDTVGRNRGMVKNFSGYYS